MLVYSMSYQVCVNCFELQKSLFTVHSKDASLVCLIVIHIMPVSFQVDQFSIYQVVIHYAYLFLINTQRSRMSLSLFCWRGFDEYNRSQWICVLLGTFYIFCYLDTFHEKDLQIEICCKAFLSLISHTFFISISFQLCQNRSICLLLKPPEEFTNISVKIPSWITVISILFWEHCFLLIVRCLSLMVGSNFTALIDTYN